MPDIVPILELPPGERYGINPYTYETYMIPAAELGQVPAAELGTMMVNGGWPCTSLLAEQHELHA